MKNPSTSAARLAIIATAPLKNVLNMTPKLVTNNICAQRDLYQEQESPDHLGHFLFAGLLYDLVEAAAGRIVLWCRR